MAVDMRPTATLPCRSRIMGLLRIFGVAGILAGALAPTRADDVRRDGLFITVPNPITENVVLQIKNQVQDAVEHQNRTLSVVVFDFNPHGKPAGTGNVFPCMDLNDFISRLSRGEIPKCPRVLTVAYVQEEVTDHTVLPVLACREIVMSSKAKLGHILRSQDKPLAKESNEAYRNAFQVKSKPDLLRKFMEPSKNMAMIDLEEAQKAGLCKARMESRPDVKDLYGLPALSLREDSLAGRTPMIWRIEIHGALDVGKLNSLERRIKTAVGQKANTIILHLDCDGGETRDAAARAERIRSLTDDGGVLPIKTIAYVPPGRSLGAATFLAVGASEIAMAPDAKLGGFDYLKDVDGQELAEKQKMLVALARSQGYHAAFFQAMLDPKLSVYLCRHKTGNGAAAVLTNIDLAQDQTEWIRGEQIVAGGTGEFFSLDAKTAQQFGIVRYSDITSPERLYERYGFDPTKVQTSRDDWLDAVAAFLRAPIVNVILIMLGIAGLILELKMPGFGVPGIVSAICFVLFFWAHAFAGQSTWEFTLLAILLFVLGVVMLGIEIFLLPGFGVTGISGIALVVLSLVLVILEHMPSTSQELTDLGAALTTVGLGLVAGMVAAVAIARYLPSIPYASRLVLEPPGEGEQAADADLTQEGLRAAELLGAIGLAVTTLRPAGKARFGEQFLDVIAEGDYVNPGARVQVIEIEGNRIVVKEVGG
jgi:membrane-bound serine protease (ClpP class)